MMFESIFGTVYYRESHDLHRVEAVKRALDWCETIMQATAWELACDGGDITVRRTINGHTVEMVPLDAANMDLGHRTAFPTNHVPMYLDGENVCVQSRRVRPRPLHIDMVASMMLLLGLEQFSPEAIPKTLHGLLSDEQLASLPPPRQRTRTPPGQPSTSGRAFLDEATVLEHLAFHPEEVFEAQFERRDGTLRNIRARTVDWAFSDDPEVTNESKRPLLPYDPRVYNLIPVMDVDIGQYRLVATDRVTSLNIGGQAFLTSSAE